MQKPIMLGAVAYDPKVIPIWDIIRDYFNDSGVRLDYILFSNYRQIMCKFLTLRFSYKEKAPF